MSNLKSLGKEKLLPKETSLSQTIVNEKLSPSASNSRTTSSDGSIQNTRKTFLSLGNYGPSDTSSSIGSFSQLANESLHDNYQQHHVVRGNLDKISRPRLALIRFYFSSNPQDSSLERAALWKNIIPSLRDHCREKHDMEFQVVDLNSGPDKGLLVSKEQRLRDIEECRETSISTGFVSLVSHKYWAPSLPNVIERQLFEILLKIAYDSKLTNWKLMEECYEKDENSIPPSYFLKHNGITLLPPIQINDEKSSPNGPNTADTCALLLQNLLRDSAVHALNSKTITSEQADTFLTSYLDDEIRCGLLSLSECQASRSVCYLRTINNMGTDMNYGRVRDYIDVLPTGKDTTGLYVTEDMLDHLAQTKLNTIRDKLLPEKVVASDGQARVYKCAVTWMPQVGLHNNSHAEYIEDFNSHLQQVVTKVAARSARQLHKSKPEHEILCHTLLAKSFYKSSHEFEQDELESAKKFVENSNSNMCVVRGIRGSGKTMLMAAIASEVSDWFSSSSKPISVVRFLGKTFVSSYVVLLLNSINLQLEKCFGISPESSSMWCTDVVYQKKRLDLLLKHATADQPVTLLLDGLDQLFDGEHWRNLLTWMPLPLPANVKIFFSLNTESSSTQEMLTSVEKSNFNLTSIEIQNISSSQGWRHLQHLLSCKNRKITSGQHVFAVQSLRKGGNKTSTITPCMLDLVLMHATKWRSSKDVTKDTIGQNEVDAVRTYVSSLQRLYGDCFVRITVSLITASKFGISGQELEELLLTYNSVIEDVKAIYPELKYITKSNFTKFSGIVKSAIAFSLHNLLADLSPLLLRKYFVGCLLYKWSNSVVENAMEFLYLASQEQKYSVQKMLVRYYVEYTARGKYLTNPKIPLKMAHVVLELPYHLKDLDRENEAMEFCFLNIFWLFAIIKSFGVVTVLFFLEQAYRSFKNNRPVLIVERSIRLAVDSLQSSPDAFPGELFSRTLPFARIFPSLKPLISQCTSYKFSTSALLPAGMHAQAPGAPLRVSFGEETEIVDQVAVYESNNIINLVYCTQDRLKIFDMVSGDLLREMAFGDDVRWLRTTRDKQFIIVLSGWNYKLCIFDDKTSEHKNINLEEYLKQDSASPLNLEHEVVSVASTSYLAIWNSQEAKRILILEIKSGKLLHKFNCNDMEVHTCLISNDEQWLWAINLPRTIIVFNIASRQQLFSLIPGTNSSRAYLVNIYESSAGCLVGVYSNLFINVWEKTPKNNNFKHRCELYSRSRLNTVETNVIHSSISDDRSRLVVVKSTSIDLWNMESWKQCGEATCRKNEVFATAHFCNEHKYLLVTLSNQDLGVYVWDLTTEPIACISIIDGHSSFVKEVIVPSATGTTPVIPWFVTLSTDDSVKVWNLENLPLIPSLTMTGRPITSVFYAGNCAVTSDMSDTVTVWRVSNADILLQLKHAAVVTHIAVSDWSHKAVTADDNNFQYVWNLRTGQNLLKMSGPQLSSLMITPNDQLVISVFENDPQIGDAAEPSRVWKLESGQVVCTFDYVMEDPQVTSHNTFLVGISLDRKLIAISLWTGMLTKILCRPGATITLIHALSWHDHVISLDTQNFVTIWNIAEEISLMSLDMKYVVMNDILICDSGSVLTMTDSKNNMKVLDVTHGRLRKINTFGIPLFKQLSWDGAYLAYLSSVETQVGKESLALDVQYYLVTLYLSGSDSIFTYPLEGVPTCLEMAKSGRVIVVGLEEGRPLVFNIVDQDSKLNYPTEYKFKKTERSIFFPKEKCDHLWFSHEPSYQELDSIPVHHTSSSTTERASRAHPREKDASLTPKVLSVHVPRNRKLSGEVRKSMNMRQLRGRTNKTRVFM